MGKLAVQKYFSFSILILTVLVMIFTLVGLYGGDVQPAGNTARAMLVYALPLLIAANVVLFLYWVIMRRFHWAFIPLIAIMCCIPYSGTIYQFGSLDEHADIKPGIKIATYNVAMFGRETSGFIAQDILAEMKRQNVDVFCIQEYMETGGGKKNSETYKETFPYLAMAGRDCVIFSKYPIKESKPFLFEGSNQAGMWADIDVKGKVIRVYNVHLETTGLNSTMHSAGKLQKQGFDVDENRLLKAIYGNYTFGMMVRTGQANIIANDRRQSTVPTIVCGDFNDVPYSYVYKTMLGDMVDGFKECGGTGYMGTYRSKKNVRIDYIFHSESLKGLSYYKVDLTYSDHYPVFMKIAL